MGWVALFLWCGTHLSLAAIGRNSSYALTPVLSVVETLPQISQALRDHSLRLVAISAWQALDSNLAEEAEIAFVPALDGHIGRRLMLLVRRDAGIVKLADLRGPSVPWPRLERFSPLQLEELRSLHSLQSRLTALANLPAAGPTAPSRP